MRPRFVLRLSILSAWYAYKYSKEKGCWDLVSSGKIYIHCQVKLYASWGVENGMMDEIR